MTASNSVRHSLLAAAAFVQDILLGAYLCRLVVRTDMLARVATVGTDVAVIVIATCVVAVASALIACRRAQRGRVLTRVLLVSSLSLAITYAVLFMSGRLQPSFLVTY